MPTLTEIAALPWNGYKVASTFSGCGGSCLGYRMAGFQVAWANEFIPAAQEVYKANHPDSILDTRNIREVTAEDILQTLGIGGGELDIFDGSPPCASFSTAGNREKTWGKVKEYSDTAQRVDDLFFEYARLLIGLQPKVFIAENVTGLVKGKAKGYFLRILERLKDCGYNVEARELDSLWLGVPQSRKRIIFIGVRNDLGIAPVFPKPLPYYYTVADALVDVKLPPYEERRWLPEGSKTSILWHDTGEGQCFEHAATRLYGMKDAWVTHNKAGRNKPVPTILQGAQQLYHWEEPRIFSIEELKRVGGFPDDFILTGSFPRQWERIGRAVPPVMMSHVAATVRDEILCKIN